MQQKRFIQCLIMRSKNLKKYLLLLCLVTLLGLLVAQRDQIIFKFSKTIANPYLRFSKVEGLTEDLQEKPNNNDNDLKVIGLSSNTSNEHSDNVTRSPATTTAKPPVLTTKTSKVTSKPSKSPSQPTQFKQVSTTYSYLGDEYATDDTYLNSSCPNRTRDILKNTEFKNIFLETIPVLQWKKHATQSEYRRLQRYLGSMGWMGVTWHILNETLHMVNSSDAGYLFDNWKGRAPCIRCAVVGNGGILNGSNMGAEIDSHDFVFRVNGATIEGFEKDVGNRTSFYVFSINTMMNSLNAYRKLGFKKVPRTPETHYLVLPDNERDYLLVRAALNKSVIDRGHDKNKRPSDFFGDNITLEHFKILHPDFMRYLRNRFLWTPILNTKHRNIYRPTTGASMLLAAVHTCDQVSAYGFITPNYAKFSDHYFDTTYKKVVFYMNHNFLKEQDLWQKLHKAGVIKLYMRD